MIADEVNDDVHGCQMLGGVATANDDDDDATNDDSDDDATNVAAAVSVFDNCFDDG